MDKNLMLLVQFYKNRKNWPHRYLGTRGTPFSRIDGFANRCLVAQLFVDWTSNAAQPSNPPSFPISAPSIS